MARVKKINGQVNGDLIGNNFNNVASSTIFNLGDFEVKTNFSGRKTRDYSNELSSFVTPITLETLGVTDEESKKVFDFTNEVVLNFDRSDLRSYVRFGSAEELFRVAITNILNTYPASIFANSQKQVGGNITISSFVYNTSTDTTTFQIPVTSIDNQYSIIFDEGNSSVPNENELRNLNLSFDRFIVWKKSDPDNNSFTILSFTGDSATVPFITVNVQGNPFPDISGGTTTGNTDYHLKPQPVEYNKFYEDLGDIEKYFLANRLDDYSAFSIQIKDPTLLETGSILYSDRRLPWTTPDGYNPITTGALFDSFSNPIQNIGKNYDEVKGDLIARFLTPASLKVYDHTDEGKMTKLLRVYGREFDQLKTFIDAIATINKVTYDKSSNIPDILVKNLARAYGWDVFQLVSEKDLTQSFFSTEEEKSDGNLLPAEIDIELWRRILINTSYYWRAKGPRNAIRSIFRLIGIPDPFINITEYIYTVDGVIDPNEVELTLEDLPSASLPYDENGYPIAPVETPDFYFQISGNSDSGQAYINNYRNVGFNVNRIVDNKKSWVQAGNVERIDSTTPNYFQEDSRLLINTKEVDVTLDTARAIEYDVFCYNQEVDDPMTSTGVTRPYIYINIAFDLTGSTTTFPLPEQPLSGSSVQLNFNGITLTSGGTGAGDYTYDRVLNQVELNTETAQVRTNGQSDVITLTYLFDRLGTTGYTQVQYLVQAPTVTAGGSVLTLPQEPKGDIQLTLNGVTLTKGTSLFTGDFIIDPNDRTRIIIQNTDLQVFLSTASPIVRVWYIVDGNPSNATKRSEAHRVDSFNSTKLFFNSGINRYVYVLDYTAFDIDSIKLTLNGITLQNGTDFTLNPSNKRQVYLQPGIALGSVIGAYYIIDDGSIIPPLLPPDPTFPDIADMTFLEYIELITRRLINVPRRKTITDNVGGYYPTVLKIYDEYLKRSRLPDSDPLQSNGYTFENLYPFINQYNGFFNRFVDQLLPSTIILKKGGILIRNTAFTRQKFKYRRGVNFDPNLQWLGDDGSEFIKALPTNSFNWTNDFVCEDIQDPSASFFVNNITITEEIPASTTTTTTLPPVPKLTIVGTNTLLLMSSDLGETWDTISVAGSGSINAVDWFDDVTALAVGGDGQVWRTANGGTTWGRIADSSSPILPGVLSSFNTVKVADDGGSTAWVGNTNSVQSIYKTVNSGTTWLETPAGGGLSHQSNDIYAYNAQEAISVSVFSNLSVVKTTDGDSFTDELQSVNLGKVDFFGDVGIAVNNATALVNAVRSDDRGDSWTDITANLPQVNGGFNSRMYNVKFGSSDVVYINGIAGVTGSSNSGQIVNTLFKSTNAGLTWTDLTNNLPIVPSFGVGMTWQNEFVGFIIYQNGTLLKTLDGGISWSTITVPNDGNNINAIGISK